jgi:hypothetical protein
MVPERTKKWFQKEIKGKYIPKEGAWETVLFLARKAIIPREFYGEEDDAYWAKVLEKVNMTEEQACFQFYLAGIGHRSLAERIVADFPNIRVSAALDPIAKEQEKNLIDELSGVFYSLYPPEYRKRIHR